MPRWINRLLERTALVRQLRERICAVLVQRDGYRHAYMELKDEYASYTRSAPGIGQYLRADVTQPTHTYDDIGADVPADADR